MSRDEEHVPERTAPIVEQNERVCARRSPRSAPDVEVDPDTGEERLVTEDVVGPPPTIRPSSPWAEPRSASGAGASGGPLRLDPHVRARGGGPIWATHAEHFEEE
ncbi:MAG: hypothetical protein EVA89_27885 [Sandaracinaceae bacterium]|nr:MAG: hypothetical protein EVA89_27885 [Sandaracinaceae bacterium]